MKFSWQQLSQTFETYLGHQHESTESLVEKEEALYPGLSPAALYTSLEDIRRIQEHGLVSGTWVDLGAGVGQTILSYLALHPDRDAYGIEKSKSRIEAGNALFGEFPSLEGQLREGDLLTADLSLGDTYFLYFPTGHVLDRILFELQKKTSFKLVAIESHGDLFSRLALEPGLRLLDEIELSSTRHHPMARIYEKAPPTFKKLELFNRSFTHEFLIVSIEGEEWMGECFGAEWIGEERFNLRTPARTISHGSVKGYLKSSELDSLTRFLTLLRQKGELEILVENGALKGEIRKIFLKPAFCLELSGGQKVKWEDVKVISLKGFRCYDSSSPLSFLLPAV